MLEYLNMLEYLFTYHKFTLKSLRRGLMNTHTIVKVVSLAMEEETE